MILYIWLFVDFLGVSSTSTEKTLIQYLLSRYDKSGTTGRPVNNSQNTVLVYYGLSLIQILDLDERNQVLTVNVWGNYNWTDEFMVWEPSAFDNITSVSVPSSKIWLPDIKLYNYADERLSELRSTHVVAYYNGEILWVPQAIYKSSCSIDITYFPFDEQTCTMKFGSWTYDCARVDIAFFFGNNKTGFDFQDYIPSNEWDIVENNSFRYVKKYECCPEVYPDLKLRLRMRRKVAFYNYILILPCVLLSSLTLVLFWLPPESPAKMQLGMNIFVAFFVLLLLLAESTPPAASSIPLIGAYYCLNMILITLSTFLSVIVVNLYFHGNRALVPRIIRKIMIDWIATVLCMRTYLLDYTDGNAENPRATNEKSQMSREQLAGNDKYVNKKVNGSAQSNIISQYKEQINPLNIMWSYPDETPPPPPNALWPYKDTSQYNKSMGIKNSLDNIEYSSNKQLYRNDRIAYSNDGLTNDKYRTRYHLPARDERNIESQESIATDMEERFQAARILERLETEVTEIKQHVRFLTDRINTKETKDKIGREWKAVALVLDRIFFFIYLGAIAVSIITIFPKQAFFEWTRS